MIAVNLTSAVGDYEIQLNGDVDLQVEADQDRIEQVVVNMVTMQLSMHQIRH